MVNVPAVHALAPVSPKNTHQYAGNGIRAPLALEYASAKNSTHSLPAAALPDASVDVTAAAVCAVEYDATP